MRSTIREELRLARLGIWSGLFYLVLRDVRANVPVILLLGICITAASLYPLLLSLQCLPKILPKCIARVSAWESPNENKISYSRSAARRLPVGLRICKQPP